MASILLGNVKGPQGDTGATGPKGDTGNAATVRAGSVTTVPYGQNARVTNSGDEHDAVFDFVIPQGRPGEQTTDMENLTLGSMTEPSEQFPVPAIGETGKVIFGKITKWFSDMTALVATKLNAANVVNNLTTTSSGYALDARQGKALNDIVSPLNARAAGVLNQSGTSIFRIDDGKYVKAGNIIICSVRGTMLTATSSGMSLPLVKLPFIPLSNTGVSTVQIGSNYYASGANTQAFDNVYYLRESAMSSIAANTVLNIFYAYITDGTSNN